MGAQTSKPDAGAGAGPAPAAQQPEEKISLSQSLLNKITSEAKITTDAGPSPTSSEKSSSSSSSSSSTPSSSSSTSSSSPSDPLPSSRQSYLDSSVRSAISSELARLRKQEAEVTAQIQSKLEAENLAIEEKHSSKSQQKSSSGGSDDKSSSKSSGGAGRSSDSLRKELDEVKRKISRHDSGRKQVENAPGVKEARKSVIECYKEVGTSRTLDCWKEVKAFTDAVEKAERNYIASLSE